RPAHRLGRSSSASTARESLMPGVTMPGATSMRWYQTGTDLIRSRMSSGVLFVSSGFLLMRSLRLRERLECRPSAHGHDRVLADRLVMLLGEAAAKRVEDASR